MQNEESEKAPQTCQTTPVGWPFASVIRDVIPNLFSFNHKGTLICAKLQGNHVTVGKGDCKSSEGQERHATVQMNIPFFSLKHWIYCISPQAKS